jgi:hypothetical protein
LREEQPEIGSDVSKRLVSVKHLLWHGNTEEALDRLVNLVMELSLLPTRSTAAKKVGAGVAAIAAFALMLSLRDSFVGE